MTSPPKLGLTTEGKRENGISADDSQSFHPRHDSVARGAFVHVVSTTPLRRELNNTRLDDDHVIGSSGSSMSWLAASNASSRSNFRFRRYALSTVLSAGLSQLFNSIPLNPMPLTPN